MKLAILMTITLIPLVADEPCPNERASEVDARIDEINTSERRCGLGLQIFGLSLSAFGPLCPTERIYYPAHQTCQGAAALGSRCEFEKTLPVEYESCDCVTATLLGTGLALPDCECDSRGILGELEDFATRNCPKPHSTQ
jgi:hypothetical protein